MAAIQFNPVAGPTGAVGATGAGPQLGLIGGASSAGPTRPATSFYTAGMDAEMGALPDFLHGIFQNVEAAQKQDRMFKGFADGVAGVTVDQVQKDKSYITKIFGPTDYEMGVTLYDTQKRVSEMAQSWSARMPELREMPHEQVTELLISEMRAAQSDNPFANTLLQKGLMDNFAPLIAQHTKERVAWQQGQMVKKQIEAAESRNAQYQMMMTQAATLGRDHPMQKEAAEALQFARKGLMDVWTTGQFQNDESRKAFLMTAVRSAARQGQFYVLETLREEGFMDSLSAEDAERLEKQIQTAEVTFKNRFASENDAFNKMIARASSLRHFGVGGENMSNMMKEINQTYQALTGSNTPYFDSDQIASWAGEATSSALRRQERFDDKQFQLSLRAMDKEEKAQLEERNAQEATAFFVNGTAGEAANLKHVQKDDLDRASAAQFNADMQAGNVELAAGRLITNFNNLKGSYVNNMLRDQFRTNLESSMDEQVNDAFMAQYGVWKQLYEGKGVDENGEFRDNAQGRAAAIAYYSPQINAKMVEFDRKVNTLGPERAYATTFGEWVTNGRPDFRGIESGDLKKNAKEFLSVVDAQGAGWFDRMFNNGYKLQPGAREQLSIALAPYWDQLGSSGMLPQHRAKAAMQLLMSEDGGRGELMGGQFIQYGRNQQPLVKYMDDPEGVRTSVLFATIMDQKAKEIGVKLDGNSVDIRRLNDDGGVPVFTVQVWNDDGVHDFMFRADEMQKYEAKALKDAETRRIKDKNAGTGYGFKLPEETDEQFQEYHGMTREEFDERGRRNRQRLMGALPYLTIPAATIARDALTE
ncbi:internal virion protein [Stenotrophomonas phage BUCT609]|uniref:Internal virion protein n=1 Tax=Stenotrophomonas phage BUCT609 TaxID=2834250 RepID=A0A8E6PL79_9CAUD|nr:internal virion protein [Stenotrophomonas phage BUCT609]